VLDGYPAPYPTQKRGTDPNFRPMSNCLLWPNGCMHQDVGLSLGDIVLDGDPTLPPLKGHSPPPQFSAHIRCGQTAGWTKMPLGTEVDLGAGHIVLDKNSAPPRRVHSSPPLFSAHVYCGPRSPISATVEILLFLIQ